MSATNRGIKRNDSDFYITPDKTIKNFLNNYYELNFPLLDPCAGNGAFPKVIRESGYTNHTITCVESRKEEYNNLLQYTDKNEIHIADFLTWNHSHAFQTIISNPPFSLAEEFIKKCFEISRDNTEIIMLLRLAFLESQKRYDFWQQYPVNELYVLSDRPSFTGHGTDATAYGFFVWKKDFKLGERNRQLIKVI